MIDYFCYWDQKQSCRGVFSPNTFRIQSECGKIRTRTTPNMDTFYAVYILSEKSLLSFSSVCLTSTSSSRQKHQVSHAKSDKCFFHVVYHFFVGWKLVQFLLSLSHRLSLAEMWAAIPGTVNLFLCLQQINFRKYSFTCNIRNW